MITMRSSNGAGQQFAWEPRHIARQRAALLASAGLTSIAIAIGVARPEPITFVIVLVWIALMGSAVIRSLRTVVSVTVRTDGMNTRTIVGQSRFAPWTELDAALTRRTVAGRELRIMSRSGALVAMVTDRISSFDDLVQVIRAHVPVNAEDDARGPDGALAAARGSGTKWTVRTSRLIADTSARTHDGLAAQGYRMVQADGHLRASSGLVTLDLELATEREGTLVTIAHRSGPAVLAMGAGGVGFTLLALGGLALAGRTTLLLPIAAVLVLVQLLGVLLWQRAAADRAREALGAVETALTQP